MRALQLVLPALVLSLFSSGAVLLRAPEVPPLAAAVADHGHLPMRFEQNVGQVDMEVRFVARGSGATLFLTEEGATLSLRAPRVEPASGELVHDRRGPSEGRAAGPGAVLAMKVAGGRAVTPRAEQRLVTISNYFIGNDPSKWRTDVPNFGRVVYPGVLPGVDLVYHGEEGQLEYDFVVAPGADHGKIAVEVSGAKELSLTSTGDLVIHTENGALLQPRPRVYQRGAGRERQDVAAGYRLLGERTVGFALASYDTSRELVIDPVLQYSTYLGGADIDRGNDIAVDGEGGAYVVGTSESVNFPRQAPLQPARAGGADVFVTRLSPAGNSLVYSTYLGGGQLDQGYGIAVDLAGSAYVTGRTLSTNFPVQGPFQPAHGGGVEDAFVAKLAPAGNALVYSTYLGGADIEFGNDITVDGAGSAHVTGETSSANFPVQNPLQPTLGGGFVDAFVTKLSPAGNTLVYSTYLGGNGGDRAHGIAVDFAGSAHVVGATESTNFPVQGPFQATNAGSGDAFVTKLSPAGNTLVYSTYLGGSANESGDGIAVDSAGSVHVTGRTLSPNFPTQSPFQAINAGGGDAFVTKLSPAGNTLVYSTYMGGTDSDWCYGVAVDLAGRAHVTGFTESKAFPVQSPFQATHGGGFVDAFVARLSPAGNGLEYSTFLGGTGSDFGNGVALDSAGNAYVTGYTNSTDFPTQGPFQALHAGGRDDAFVAKLVVLSPLDAGADAPDASADAPDTGADAPDASADASDSGIEDASAPDSGIGDASPSLDSAVGPIGPARDGSAADAAPPINAVDGGACQCLAAGAPGPGGAADLSLVALAALAFSRRRSRSWRGCRRSRACSPTDRSGRARSSSPG